MILLTITMGDLGIIFLCAVVISVVFIVITEIIRPFG